MYTYIYECIHYYICIWCFQMNLLLLLLASAYAETSNTRQIARMNDAFIINCPNFVENTRLESESLHISKCTETSTFITISKIYSPNKSPEYIIDYPAKKRHGISINKKRINPTVKDTGIYITIMDAYLTDIGTYCCKNQFTNEQLKTNVIIFKEGTDPTISINGEKQINNDYYLKDEITSLNIKCTIEGEFPTPQIYLAKDNTIVTDERQRYGSIDFVVFSLSLKEEFNDLIKLECMTINALGKAKQKII